MRDRFSNRLGFILISAGCAIGIGNVWRFPYIVGQYGGAVFVLIYLFFLVILGLPVMVMEYSVGRASQKSAALSFDVLEPKGTKWHFMKYVAMAGNYILMMFYTSVCGWGKIRWKLMDTCFPVHLEADVRWGLAESICISFCASVATFPDCPARWKQLPPAGCMALPPAAVPASGTPASTTGSAPDTRWLHRPYRSRFPRPVLQRSRRPSGRAGRSTPQTLRTAPHTAEQERVPGRQRPCQGPAASWAG